MQIYLFIVKTFKLLREHQPWKLSLIFMLTLLNGVMSGFSIVLLIPLLQLLNIGSGGEPEGIALFIQELAERAGISLNIGSILVVYMVLLTLSALLQYWKAILDARYQQTFIYTLRRRLFRKIIMADWQLLNSRSKTNHLQVLTREVPNLANYYLFYLRLLTTVIMMAAYTAYALLVSAPFTLIIIATGGLLFILLRRFLLKSFRLGKGYVDSYTRLLKYIDDFWQTVKIAKVHSSEDYYYNRFDEASTSLLNMEYRMQRNWSLPQLIQRLAGLTVLVGIVWFGYRSGSVPMTSFVILILLFSRIFPQLTAINTDINMIVSNVPSVKLVMQLDDDLPEPVAYKSERHSALTLKEGIQLENISFSWPDGGKLFDGFSAAIRAHTITGIVGQSGRGKTTLIDLIAGLQKPDGGKILIDGKPLDEDLLPGWKAGLGYLPQDPFFIDGTLRENLVWDSVGQGDQERGKGGTVTRDGSGGVKVSESSGVTDEEIMSVLEQVNATHLITRFRKGLDAFVVNYHTTFSGGECQRLALARVLLRRPTVLLLDEATSSLDAENETVIMEVLEQLREKVTIVFVTHRDSVSGWFDSTINI
ncbi:MAG: ABC transporter ATP-binding protein [Bacteroidales bacterium]|jgi:ATP-binding cassette subfamily C protein|nr:ABC transporter ATP-binding protein [Bacteroidales bacterium]